MQTLYRFFDQDNQLLYVGISASWRTRMHQHEKNAAWWNQVITVKLEYFASRAEVEAAEKKAIISEKPIWNKTFNVEYESPREHFDKIKSYIRFNNPDDLHKPFVEVMQEALRSMHNQSLNCKAQFVAAVFVDNYGFPAVDCRNCAAIESNTFIWKLAEYGWRKSFPNEY